MDQTLAELERRVRASPGDAQARAELAAARRRLGSRAGEWCALPWPPQIGDVVGPWRVAAELELRRRVWYAPGIHVESGAPVQLALYPASEPGTDPAEVEAAEVAAWLLDPDLAELSGTAGDVAWVVPSGEWPAGAGVTTLAARVEREGPLPVREAARLALGVAECLERLRDAGRFAWDVTPSRLVESRAGTVGLLFGGGRTPHQPLWISESITGPGPPLGTPLFAPQELMQGTRERLAPLRDVHHAGMSLRWALTGRGVREAIAGETFLQFFQRLRDEGEVEPLLGLRPDTPPGLAALGDACVRRDPEERWPHDLPALIAELRRFLAGEPLTPPPRMQAEPEPTPARAALARVVGWIFGRPGR